MFLNFIRLWNISLFDTISSCCKQCDVKKVFVVHFAWVEKRIKLFEHEIQFVHKLDHLRGSFYFTHKNVSSIYHVIFSMNCLHWHIQKVRTIVLSSFDKSEILIWTLLVFGNEPYFKKITIITPWQKSSSSIECNKQKNYFIKNKYMDIRFFEVDIA